MKTLFIALILIATFLLLTLATIKRRSNKNREMPRGKEPLTKNEQLIFFRLTSALPEHVVLAQVSFSSLITARSISARNTFDRKTADFVICNKSFEVIAIVELDDSSHKGREIEDGKRDLLLTNAGYKVLRYKQIPDIEKVKADVIVKPHLKN